MVNIEFDVDGSQNTFILPGTCIIRIPSTRKIPRTSFTVWKKLQPTFVTRTPLVIHRSVTPYCRAGGANRICSNCEFYDDTMKALFREKVHKKVSKKWVPRSGTVYGLIEILSCLFGIPPDFDDFIYEGDLHVSTLHFPSTLSQGFCGHTDRRTDGHSF